MLRTIFILAASLSLGGCAQHSIMHGTSHAADNIVDSRLKAVPDIQHVPLPLAGASLLGKEQRVQPIALSLSNYRVFSMRLQKGERYRLSTDTPCARTCLGFNDALKPKALLLDSYGRVIEGQSATLGGHARLSWNGEVTEDGLYYLLLVADGKTVVVDDIWINNSPLMAVKAGSGHLHR